MQFEDYINMLYVNIGHSSVTFFHWISVTPTLTRFPNKDELAIACKCLV